MNTIISKAEKNSEFCINCAFKIKDESMLRCGFDYFQIPPLERKMPRLSSFEEVAPDHVCLRWRSVADSVLKASSS